MLKGTIILITSDQRYGTLRGDDGIDRLFERPEQSLRELLSEGDRVTFLAHNSSKGAAASGVQLEACPYCQKPMHTSAHMSVCPMRPPGVPPPQQAVKMQPARIGGYMVHWVPFSSQADRGRFFVYDLSNVEVGTFIRFDNAVNFALGNTGAIVEEPKNV